MESYSHKNQMQPHEGDEEAPQIGETDFVAIQINESNFNTDVSNYTLKYIFKFIKIIIF